MSRSPMLGSLSYNTEATWAEVSSVFNTRLPMIGQVDVSGLKRPMLIPDRTVQYRNEISPGVPGIFGGEFKTKFMVTGHGSTTAGVIVLSALETLLGIVIGNVAAARAAGGTTATAGGTVTALNVSAVNGYSAGSLIPCGSLNDGRGNGQFIVAASHATSIITSLIAVDAILNNGDVIRNPAQVYTTESPVAANDITSTRWLFQTANLCFEAHGCYPKSITISGLNTAEEISLEINWGVSWWTPINMALPNATAVQWFAHAPVANGSFFLNTYGTPTRQKYSIRSFALTYQLGIVELMGPGGVNASQAVVACKRTQDKIAIEFSIDADNTTATPDLFGKWASGSVFHFGYTLNVGDGSSFAIYSPYLVPDGDQPAQIAQKSLNAARLRFRCGVDNTKATDLERSALRMAIG